MDPRDTRVRRGCEEDAVVSWGLEISVCDGDAWKTQLFHEAMSSIAISSKARDRDAGIPSEVIYS